MSISNAHSPGRRRFIGGMTAATLTAGAFASPARGAGASEEAAEPRDSAAGQALAIDPAHAALVLIDPQNDVLSPSGLAWGAVGESVRANNTVENIERLLRASKQHGHEVFVSPHYFYPTDCGWATWGPLESVERHDGLFARTGPLDVGRFEGSGADWLAQFRPYIEDGRTVVVSPHKVWGSQTNDLVLQLRKRRIGTVILAGMLANMCVESHLRDLLEQGFEVMVVKDATAAPRHPEWGDGYPAALVNFAFLAHAVVTTDDATRAMAVGR
jgi:nicotinamidase-related amidase